MHINIEIKARCDDAGKIRSFLQSKGADFRGTDLQTDTYFRVINGRLKLRQGNIENALIHYFRDDIAGPKRSDVILYPVEDTGQLKVILEKALGIRTVVRKKREIYFIENVKFHIDEVDGLGSFVEIEAIDFDGSLGIETLQTQCKYYITSLGIPEEFLEMRSYSDMLLNKAVD